MSRKVFYIVTLVLLLSSCSAYKYVPEGEYLLRKTSVKTDIPKEDLGNANLKQYLRQTPNSRIFGVFPMSLHLYSLSGKDSTRWINRFLHKIGSAPQVYSDRKRIQSANELQKFAQSKGFVDASVITDVSLKKRKAYVTYNLYGKAPYRLRNFSFHCRDTLIQKIVRSDSIHSLLRPGALFDLDVLDSERQRIASLLQRNGYYNFGKENMHYVADSTKGTNQVDVRLLIRSRVRHQVSDSVYVSSEFSQYKIGRVFFFASYDPINGMQTAGMDSVVHDGYVIYYTKKLKLRPKVLIGNCYVKPGELYNERHVERTYTAFNVLPAINYVDIRFVESKTQPHVLDCLILLAPGKPQSYSLDIEGTNSNGDLGFAGILGYQHKNIFRGSETLKASIKYARETETGSLSDLLKHTSNEVEGNISLRFPKFLFPFIKQEFKQKVRATTEFGFNYNYQRRAEFSRTYSTASVKYNWISRNTRLRQTVDLCDISYIYLPYVSDAFRERYLNSGSILKYSYEDQLLVGCGYSFSLAKQPISKLKDNFTLRFSAETAGNLFYVLSPVFRLSKVDGSYTIGKIKYAQYIRGTVDFSYDKFISKKNNIVFHIGAGMACPYGNSSVVPFEKRFISGGANSVRGWSVRTLGPGTYSYADDIDYMNQSGDIKLDLNIEYRFKMFWRIEGALFADAGNVWTLNEYNTQPGGKFHFSDFYKQMALGYGAGLRFDFTYFLVRFDFGLKAYDPSKIAEGKAWRFANFKWENDKAFHFAIGYPF
ncbi:MAG: BamA/TamA family outer membrane protein [Bacteroidales bacterium]|nr:BamA/TamA family outer membrane protein [Bacteroidales bacterium]